MRQSPGSLLLTRHRVPDRLAHHLRSGRIPDEAAERKLDVEKPFIDINNSPLN